jgi:uncharacterized ubiquitin-like protein YukD
VSEPTLDSINIILMTSMGTESWNLNLPMDVSVQALIAKLVDTPQLNFQEQDHAGQRIPYRLMSREQGKYLLESQTLRSAEVHEGDTLVMMHEARAGRIRSVVA